MDEIQRKVKRLRITEAEEQTEAEMLLFAMDEIQRKAKKLRITEAEAESETETETETEAERDWAWLPCNVQDMILEKLVSLTDYIRFGAVCKSWLQVSLEDINRHSSLGNHQLPMLMIPHRFDENRAGLYSVTHEQILKFELSLPYHQRFVGSSFRWLISFDTKPAFKLFNPFMPVHNDWSDRVCDFRLDDILFNSEYSIVKAVLSADPISHPDDFGIMIIHSESRRIYYVRPGGKPAKCLSRDVKGFTDLMYLDGAFYALHEDGQVWIIRPQVDGRVWIIRPQADGQGLIVRRQVDDDEDQDGEDITVMEDMPDALTISQPLRCNEFCFARYIVEGVKGEILQVLRYGEPSTDGFPSCSTQDFQVFKLDRRCGNWIELQSLGDEVLFVGDNASLSVLASDYPGCQPGAIYCSFAFHPQIMDRNLSDDIIDHRIDIAAFNLENRTITPCNFADDHALCFAMHQFPPMWIVPTFQAPDFSSTRQKSMTPSCLHLESEIQVNNI